MSVKTRLISGFAVICMALLSLYLVIINQGLKRFSQQDLDRTLTYLGRNTAYNLRTPVFYGDVGQIDALIQPLILTEHIDYTLVVDLSSQKPLSRHDKQDWLAHRQSKITEHEDATPPDKHEIQIKKEAFTEYHFPITLEEVNQPIGLLIIGISHHHLYSRLDDLRHFSTLITFSLFITLLLAIYLIASRTIRPLKKLDQLIRRFADGQYQVRSPIISQDEVGALSNNFNLMAEKINEQIASIENYSKNLETMVEERTEKLRKAMDEIKEKDRRLMQAERLNSLNSLVSSIAHEINNPMAIISGNVQILENRVENPDVQKRLQTISGAITRISKLMNEVNFFSSIRDVTITGFSFQNLLNSVTERIVPPTVQLNIHGDPQLRISSNHNLMTITLTQVLQNCVDAFRDRGIPGEITVRYGLDGRVFILSIEDNGGGVKEPKKIFDPFYSSSSERKGLGLTFAYHAVTALEGEISIENTDQGAIVYIFMPQGPSNTTVSNRIVSEAL
jgi:signal transduction histidine kinase